MNGRRNVPWRTHSRRQAGQATSEWMVWTALVVSITVAFVLFVLPVVSGAQSPLARLW